MKVKRGRRIFFYQNKALYAMKVYMPDIMQIRRSGVRLFST